MSRWPALVAVTVGACALAVGLQPVRARPTSELPSAPATPTIVGGVDLRPIVAALTDEQKVGQLLVLGFGGVRLDSAARKLLREKKPGAVALFSRNVGTRAQVKQLTSEIREELAGEIPPFIAVDQEGGNVIRLKDDTTLLPGAMALGATRSASLAEAAGRAVGADLRALGFNMNFAPVLDVNSNPDNPVIGVRSFGERPELVAELGSAFIAGLRAAGVAAVAKHFPGHGDTSSDSHYRLPSVPHGLERLTSVELMPFKRAASEGLAATMTAHLAMPAITGERELPSSLSDRVLTGLLRRQMQFGGIIMTDGLEMEAVAGRFGAGRAAVRAVRAGADMVMVLWYPERKDEVHRALLDAVRSGEIPRARLNDAVSRVLAEKARLGLLGPVPPPPTAPGLSTDHVDAQVAEAAITLVKNEGEVVPLSPDQRVLVVAPDRMFARVIQEKIPNTEVVLLPSTAGQRRQKFARRDALRAGRGVDVAVVAAINDVQMRVARALMADRPGRPVVVVSLLSPYLLQEVPKVDAYLCTYSYLRPAQLAAAKVLTGQVAARGRLPVTIPRLFAFGDGILPPRSAAVR